MNAKLLVASSVRSMSRYRLRTFFMSIGIVVGVASLIVGRSLGAGAERELKDKIDIIFGPGSIIVMSRTAGTMKIADIEAIEQQLEQIVAWDPTVGVGNCEVRVGDTNRQATIFGHSERAEQVWHRTVIEGRYFTAADLEAAARVALIGTSMATILFGDEDPIEREIQINSVPFRVIGVLEPVGIDPHGMDRDEDIMVPTTTAMRRLRSIDYIGTAKLLVRDPEQVDQDAELVAAVLRERHRIAEGEDDDFAIYTSKFAGRKAQGANKVLKFYFPAAAGIVLLLAGIVITSVMMTTIRQRVPEIGLRKALGATETVISQQFLAEAVGVSLFSGVVGLALGLTVALALSRLFEQPTLTTFGSVAMGFSAAVIVGIASGLLPARKAARLNPVEALR
jgi:putative ABC transport system permease protein